MEKGNHISLEVPGQRKKLYGRLQESERRRVLPLLKKVGRGLQGEKGGGGLCGGQ